MGHLSHSARMSLESKWRRYNKHQIDIKGRDDLEARIEQGERIMGEHNQGKPAEQRIGWLLQSRGLGVQVLRNLVL